MLINIASSLNIDNASSVDEAFKKLTTGTYDIVVSDYEMPQKDGLEFLKELREQNNKIPFILFTGKGREEVAIKALNLGVDGYFNKQGSPETVYGELCYGIIQTVNHKQDEEALRKSEEQYRTYTENSPVAFFVVNSEGKYIQVNNAATKLLLYSKNELLKMSIVDILFEKDITVGLKQFASLKETGKSRFETALKRKDGEPVYAILNAIQLSDGNMMVFCEDITEQRKTQEKDLFLSSMVEGSEDAIISKSLSGFITSWNKSAERIYGYSEDEVIGKSIQILAPPQEKEEITQILKKIFAGEAIKHYHAKRVRKDGIIIDVSLSISPIKNENGTIIGASTIARDVTEQEKLEEESKFQTDLLNSVGQAITMVDVNRTILFWNKAAEKLYGYSKEQALGHQITEILGSISHDEAHDVRKRIMAGESWSTEDFIKNRDGSEVPIILRRSPIYNKNKKVVGVASISTDITFQKKTESELKIEKEALRESETKLSIIIENSSDQIFMLDKNLKYLFVNKTLGDILGKAPKEIIGKSLNEVYCQETASKFSNNIKNVFETGKSILTEEKMVAQGHELYISTRSNPVQNDKGNIIAVAGIVRDITESKKAEEAIKFQANLLNQVGQAIIMVDNNRIVRFWNKTAEKLYGYSEEQALGLQINELLGNPPREETEKVMSKLMAGESWSTETSIKKKDGSVVQVILNRTPLFKENGEFSGAASITTDITLQKSTEADLTFSLEYLSNSLSKIQELNEKLRVIGGLTRHDVRNKLSAVTGYAYILKKKHADEADVVEGLSKMEQAVRESMKIFEFAKMYEQLGVEELVDVDVEAKINEATTLFSGTLPKIKNQCHGLTVLADSFLRQMFYNFIDNTRKYGKKTTTIKVHYHKTDQGNLELIYEDDGVGISAENKLKLFSEGFSTGGSTGFGLFLTKKMIDVYGWNITEEGEPGKGAKFVITIPNHNKDGKENYQIVP